MVTIKKAKIKNNLFLSFEFIQKFGDYTAEGSSIYNTVIHDDLRVAFKNLAPHFALLCEEIPEKTVKHFLEGKLEEDHEIFRKFKVSSFSIGGSGDTEGVSLSGAKMTENGARINFNAPFTKWDDEYKFMDELIDAVDLIRNEVHLYMDGKQAPKAQQEMHFDDFDVETFEETA